MIKFGFVGDKMDQVRLTDICNPRQWKTIPTSDLLDKGFPVYGANGIIGYYSEYNHESPVIAITCRGATCGAINITMPHAYITGNAMCLDDVRHGIDIKYLYYCLLQYDFSKVISGSAQPQITRQGLEKVNLRIGTPTEQQMIIAVLDRVKALIVDRQRQLTALDTLIKARFVEMFGTFPVNEKSWKTGTIRDLVTEVRYGSSRKAANGNSGQYPYLRMNNITYGGELDLTDTKTIDIPDNELDKCTVRRGDLLFNRTNSKELVGKTCVYNRDETMVLAGFVVRVRLNEKALPEFVSTFMNTDFSKQMLLNMCKAAIGQANINAQELQNIGIYIPPIDIQKEFVSFKDQIDKSKSVVQESLAQSQLLFDSLMQKYFG